MSRVGIESLAGPMSPEASLRYAVSEIVDFFGEPTKFYVSLPRIVVGENDSLHHEVVVSKDSVSEAELGVVGVQILAQEVANPEIDEQLPFHITVRAKHKLGNIFAHISLPSFTDPLLVPSDLQKSRPTIAATVESKVRHTFDKGFMLNEILGELEASLESCTSISAAADIQLQIDLIKLMDQLIRPVKAKNGKTQDMTEDQVLLVEKCITELFWPGSKERVEGTNPTFRSLYQAMVARFVKVRFGI